MTPAQLRTMRTRLEHALSLLQPAANPRWTEAVRHGFAKDAADELRDLIKLTEGAEREAWDDAEASPRTSRRIESYIRSVVGTRPPSTGDASPSSGGQLEMSALQVGRICAWCRGPIDDAKRSHAKFCRTACRKAANRFRVRAGPRLGDAQAPMRIGYADPPYPGKARACYGSEEVDHGQLVAELVAKCPDGWALSTSSEALQDVLAICPPGVRLGVWVHPRQARGDAWHAHRVWEALIVYGGRPEKVSADDPFCDVYFERARGGKRAHPDALVGMKPPGFAEWMFRMVGLRAGDVLVDVFPGSGSIGRAWQLYNLDESASELPSCLELAQERLASVEPSPSAAGRFALELREAQS